MYRIRTFNSIRSDHCPDTAEISIAALGGSIDSIERIGRKLSELKRVENWSSQYEERLSAMSGTKARSKDSDQLREITILVLPGMITQSLLSLTPAIKSGIISPGEKLSIEAFPSRERFDTVLLPVGNKLQKRGKVGKFYREAGVRAGDTVVLREVGRGRWELRKQ